MDRNLTKQQRYALMATFTKGAAFYGVRRRAGGAYARMCQRLAERGYLDAQPPHALTPKGREALGGVKVRR